MEVCMRFILSAFASILIAFSAAQASEETVTINFNITLDCPPSVEREALESIIPSPDYQSPNHEEWIRTTLNELDHVRALVRSGHFENATVNFGSNNPNAIDESQRSSVSLALTLQCLPCKELEDLSTQSENQEKNSGYHQWVRSTIKALQNIQMLIIKNQIIAANSHQFNTHAMNQPLTEVTYHLDLKGPMSEEFQALLDALAKDGQRYESYEEWSVYEFNVMHKLEQLILSGKLNQMEGRINVGDRDS